MIKNKFWKGKRVLITGHTGFKGGWLSLWLHILGANIVGYSLNPITKKNFFTELNLKKIFKRDIRGDIQNLSKLKETIKKFKPQIIFHLAAQPQVLESYITPINTIKTNVLGTANLLEIARNERSIKSIVIITTDKVYRNFNKKIKFDENFPLGGDDIYSSSKASADLISSSYIKSFFFNKKCNVSIARAGNCIGGGDWTKFRILTDSTNAFLKNKKLILRNPYSVRPWQHVLEPLEGYIILAQKLFGAKGKFFSGPWNFGPQKNRSINVLNFSRLLKKKLLSQSKIEIRKNFFHQKEKNYLDLDSKKAIKKLSWKPILNFEKTLSLTAEWYKAYKRKENLMLFSINQIKFFMSLKKKIK